MSRFLLILLLFGVSYVTADQLECGPNELQVDCPNDCPSDECPKGPVEYASNFCKTSTNKKDCSPAVCRCRLNHRRDANQTCIDIKRCPPFDCSKKPNEEYVACPLPVCSDSCSAATSDGKCHIFGRIGVVLVCNPQCRCIKNYWRKDGVCVPYAECGKTNNITLNSSTIETSTSETKTSDENSVASNAPAVDTSKSEMETDYDNAVTPDSSAVESSKPETISDDGTPKLNCLPNEIKDDCPSDCEYEYCAKTREEAQPKSCSRPNQAQPCPPPKCKCGFNQRRSENGTCISVYDCPTFECNGPYEEYVACPSYCPGESCESATPDGTCPPLFGSLIVVRCQQSCRCIKNYWRKNGVCVPYAECGKGNETTPVVVKPNEGKKITFIQTDDKGNTDEKQQ